MFCRFLFSAGVGDRSVNMFNIDLDTFEYTIASGLAEEDAFNELIGGRNSDLYKVLQIFTQTCFLKVRLYRMRLYTSIMLN